MDFLQPESIKIQKRPLPIPPGKRNYICGGCEKSYKSYPALYLHIKRKHDGQKPQGTCTRKSLVLAPEEKVSTVKPQKVIILVLVIC